MDLLMDGALFLESPRWHDERLWFSDWGAGCVYSLDPHDGLPAVVEAEVTSFPLCIDFLPDGHLLLVSSADHTVLRREADAALVVHADLAPVSTTPWNDIVVDAGGNAYVNSIGFDFPREPAAPGLIALVRPDGQVTVVAEDLAFPNGMALSADGATLLVAESYAEHITAYDVAADATLSRRRVWAPTPGEHPDGICLDATGALWYADVGHHRCVRVREGGAVLDSVELDRGGFACTLSTGTEPTLFVTAQHWGGPSATPQASGQVLAFPAPAPGINRL